MTSEVFVDASAYYAMLDPRDGWHKKVKECISQLESQDVRYATTDYILDEVVTLLQSRGLSYVVGPWLDDLMSNQLCHILWMNPERFEQVRQFFVKHHDKQWSFTDCFSFCVMQEHRIRLALASDDHFRQAGFEPLLIS